MLSILSLIINQRLDSNVSNFLGTSLISTQYSDVLSVVHWKELNAIGVFGTCMRHKIDYGKWYEVGQLELIGNILRK